MNNKNKCDKYEAYFVFQDEESFNNHLKNCPDCREKHKKYLKVSELVKEVAPVYLKQQEKKKASTIKKLACCFIFMVGFSSFAGYRIYDENSFQISTVEDSYISAMGLPIDEYGFLEI